MSRQRAAPLLTLTLDEHDARPRHRQIYAGLRDAVLAGHLRPGTRLPSSRDLARDLNCARNTVLTAYGQLESEGYLVSRRGSGSFVSPVLPEDLLDPQSPAPSPRTATASPPPRMSPLGRNLAAASRQRATRAEAFAPGLPDLHAFPFEQWGRLLGSIWRHPEPSMLRERHPAGLPALRQAIAEHLNAVRGLGCSDREVLVTSGSQQALDLVARLLLEPGDRAWIEDPGYPGLRGPLQAAGIQPVPVPVDSDGLQVDLARQHAPSARLALVAPSHQYPLGHALSLPRRLALLDWAHETDAWIVEDDYDSEYRYAGRPLAALRSLEVQRHGDASRVIYLGSFSKVLYPGLRLGYLVLPAALAEDFALARRALDDHPAVTAQPAVARFLRSGQFAAHMRRTRLLYQRRQQCLLAAARRHLGGRLILEADDAGMHLVARVEPAWREAPDDLALARHLARAGITVSPLSSLYLGKVTQQGLLMGYAAVPERAIEPAVARMAEALAEL